MFDMDSVVMLAVPNLALCKLRGGGWGHIEKKSSKIPREILELIKKCHDLFT